MASHDDQHRLAAQLLPSLEAITIWSCESIQVLWDFEGMMKFTNNIGGHGGDSSSSSSKPKPVLLLFDRLQDMSLMYLDGLKQIWRIPRTRTTRSIYVIKAFQNLKTLSVFYCGSLRHLLSVSMAQMLVGLEELFIRGCDKMEEVIAAEAEEGCRGGDNEPLLILPSLHQLRIMDCQMLTKFCVGSKLSAPKLKQVQLRRQVIPEDLKDREVIFIDEFGRKVEGEEGPAESAAAKKKKKKKEKEKEKKAAAAAATATVAEDKQEESKNETKAKVSDKKLPKHVWEMQEKLARLKEAEERNKKGRR